MKKLLKKNQIIITALAVMIAAAGYLNYSGTFTKEADKKTSAGGDLTNVELLDISEEDLTDANGEIAQLDEGEIPGEAVLTSGNASSIVAQAKINREQIRAKNKETLQAIIDDANLGENQKAEAVQKMVEMTDIAEKEVVIENLLASKGFSDAVVSLTEDSADIIVNGSELSEAKRAQIEDIVVRKADIAASNIVITPIHSQSQETQENSEK